MNVTNLISALPPATEIQQLAFRKEDLDVGNVSSKQSTTKLKTILPWDKFSQWVNAILVVTFDIEMGQSLESIYPSMLHVKLSPNEKLNICYMVSRFK